jgi:hypothetical protein
MGGNFMQKEKIKELIVEQKITFLTKTGLTKRDNLEQIAKYISCKEIILITGVRRSGKSSLMRLICDELLEKRKVNEENILYLNFEDERFVDFSVKDFESIDETFLEINDIRGTKYFFLDEIQNIKNWEKWVNRLYEFEDIKFFITGSNSTLLSSEIATALTGRNMQLVIWPFSFKEYLLLNKIDWADKNSFYMKEKKIQLKKAFKKYVSIGGFPEILKANDTVVLEQYYKDILYKDLITRYSIRNIKEFKELCLYLVSNSGSIASYDNLKKVINAKNITTIKNYIDCLDHVFLIFRMSIFDYSVKKQIYNPGKFYTVDTGLSGEVGFKFSSNLGRMYENVVYLELRRRNKDIYYWKSKNGKEVDFLIRHGYGIETAIQVCYNIDDPKTKEREISALLDIRDELKPKNLLILTDNYENVETIKGQKIKYTPLWKWLLN